MTTEPTRTDTALAQARETIMRLIDDWDDRGEMLAAVAALALAVQRDAHDASLVALQLALKDMAQ